MVPNQTHVRRHLYDCHKELPTYLHLSIDKPLRTHILISVLMILSSLKHRQDATRHNHLRDVKRHRDAKIHPDGLRTITIIMIQEK